MSFYLVLVTTSIALIYFIYQWAKLADRVDIWRAQQHSRAVQRTIDQLNLEHYFNTQQGKAMKYSDKQWHPTIEEWCWYGFELVQVIDIQPNHIKICRQQSGAYEEVQETDLEPFMGILPSFIRIRNESN